MRRIFVLLLLIFGSHAFSEDINTVGIVSTGAIGNEGSGLTGNFRGSSGFEAARPNPTISVFDSSTANTFSEAAYVWGSYDSNFQKRKTASVSAMWVNTNTTNGFAVLRLNAAGMVGGTGTDDVFMRGYFQHGVTFFGTAEDDWFGYKTVGIRGQIYTAYGIQVDGTDFYLNSRFGSADYTKGIALGYEGTTNDGAIHCMGAPCGVSIWPHNGTNRLKAFEVDQTGKVNFYGNRTATYNGGTPYYINIKIDGEDYQLIAYKKP